MEEYIKSTKAAIAAAVGLLTGLWGWLGWTKPIHPSGLRRRKYQGVRQIRRYPDSLRVNRP